MDFTKSLIEEYEILEAKKKKRKKRKTPRVTYTTGWPWYNSHMFNHHIGSCDCNKDKDEVGEDAADNANDAIGGGESVGDAGSLGGEFGGDFGGGEGGAMGEGLVLEAPHLDPADYWDEDPNWMNVNRRTKSADWDIINKAKKQRNGQGYTTYGKASKANVQAGTYISIYGAADSEKAKEAYLKRLEEHKLDVRNFHAAYDNILEDEGMLGVFNKDGVMRASGVYGQIKNCENYKVRSILTKFWVAQFKDKCEIYYGTFGESLTEAKRYVRRYYIRPQNIFCSNKADIIKALIDIGDQNCSVYTLNNLGDEKDVSKLMTSDIIYYYDEGILYDKNHVKVMDYDLYIKHEENRPKVADVDKISDEKFNDMYDDRITDSTGFDESINKKAKFILSESSAKICCICGETIEGYGNNAEPYAKGKCCDACNIKFVIPARLNNKTEE